MTPPTLLQRTARIWDRNVKAARKAYVAALKARFANPSPDADRLVEQTRASLETAVATMQEDQRRVERARTEPCRSAK